MTDTAKLLRRLRERLTSDAGKIYSLDGEPVTVRTKDGSIYLLIGERANRMLGGLLIFGCSEKGCGALAHPEDGLWTMREREGQITYVKSHYCKQHALLRKASLHASHRP